ncbi:MAG: flagellar biosynthetic protein FliR, partial [Bacillota bacterium]|nr:flagellar biosynthetic protein FliR [Bacillota bacterium]
NELIFGVFLGFIVSIYLGFIYFAGDVIDYLIGFSMVSVMNPLDENQMPVTSNLLYVYLTLVFLSLDLHHKLIVTLADSFVRVELGSFIKAAESLTYLMRVVSETLMIGFSIAAPVVITILVADIVLGLLSKAMPGMNIFVLGMPFKILIGVSMFMLVIPVLYDLFGEYINKSIDIINEFIRGVGQ